MHGERPRGRWRDRACLTAHSSATYTRGQRPHDTHNTKCCHECSLPHLSLEKARQTSYGPATNQLDQATGRPTGSRAKRAELTSDTGRFSPGTVTVIFFVSADDGSRMGLSLRLLELGKGGAGGEVNGFLTGDLDRALRGAAVSKGADILPPRWGRCGLPLPRPTVTGDAFGFIFALKSPTCIFCLVARTSLRSPPLWLAPPPLPIPIWMGGPTNPPLLGPHGRLVPLVIPLPLPLLLITTMSSRLRSISGVSTVDL